MIIKAKDVISAEVKINTAAVGLDAVSSVNPK